MVLHVVRPAEGQAGAARTGAGPSEAKFQVRSGAEAPTVPIRGLPGSRSGQLLPGEAAAQLPLQTLGLERVQARVLGENRTQNWRGIPGIAGQRDFP